MQKCTTRSVGCSRQADSRKSAGGLTGGLQEAPCAAGLATRLGRMCVAVVMSGAIERSMHCCGEDSRRKLRLTTPFFGEAVAGLLGLIPNCAVSVAGAELYCQGAMSAGALMASSFTGSGLGLLVLFRTNRNLKENLSILVVVYVIGTLLGWITGTLI